MTHPAHWKHMKMRYAGTCRECGAAVDKGAAGVYDRSARNILCLMCVGGLSHTGGLSTATVPVSQPQSVMAAAPADPSAETPDPLIVTAVDDSGVDVPGGLPALGSVIDIDPGTPGASARREYERRSKKREDSIRQRHPKLGGLILALTNDPQSTTAWNSGAIGEEKLGQRLNGLAEAGIRVLHDRQVPRSTANIDHIAVSSGGVFVLDAKRYRGRPELRVEGGLLRPRTETLLVGGRRKNNLIDGVHKQVAVVTKILDETVPITGMLVFVEADWPLIGGSFRTQGVPVVWQKKALAILQRPGPLSQDDVDRVFMKLAKALRPA